MTTSRRLDSAEASERRRTRGRLALAVAIAVGLGGAAGPASANKKQDNRRPHSCSEAAAAQYTACNFAVGDDLNTAQAICINTSDPEERKECLDEARAERKDASGLCREQREARRELCDELGEDPYDPSFDPADFDANFGNPSHPNPYVPLGIGNHWRYVGGDETIETDVLDETKLIEGVTCIVVHDRAIQDGELVEDTDDWFGQRKDGTVDYCGEISQELETFDGDDPEAPELVSIEGSWKAGRDGARPGTLFLGSPSEGRVYRQEWAPGTAEDAAKVLSTSYRFGDDSALDEFVPEDLATLLCAAGDCVVTGEFSPISPDSFERKYYAKGIGLFLEVAPESGEIVQLVECNMNPKCSVLPTP